MDSARTIRWRRLVFGASGATVDTVIVDGKILVEGGRITAFDMQPILSEVRDLVRRQRAPQQRAAGLGGAHGGTGAMILEFRNFIGLHKL